MQRVYRQCQVSPSAKDLALQETIFHNANGYIGVRGTLEEGLPEGTNTMRGIYLNGFYEDVPMKQAERLTNVCETKESMINAADTQGMCFAFSGEDYRVNTGTITHFERILDMDHGTTERRVTWRSASGKETELVIRRMTSFACPECFTIDYQVTPVNYSGEVAFTSTQLALVKNYADPNDPRLAGESECHLVPIAHELQGDASYLTVQTKQSHLTLVSGVRHDCNLPAETSVCYNEANHSFTHTGKVALAQGQTLRVVKYSIFADSRRYTDPLDAAKSAMSRAFGHVDTLYEKQTAICKEFWESADMHIDGDEDANLSMQFNLYQLFQSAGRDGVCSIAAKGLSGEGYEGHYFWDTEMYMMPFFILTMPELARKLLSFRYHTLDAARANARLLGHDKGALFPWRTITGRECSGYFPAGTAQYHIDGDIAYAVATYYMATGDQDYLCKEGAEILLETARLWLSVGYMVDGVFRINCVTGPDEYTAMVNNNYYTNACAKYNLEWAVRAAKLLKEWGCYDAWASHLSVTNDELRAMQDAADRMLLPYDEKTGINPQDDSFLMKPVWDLASTPKENFPLLLHYHALELYRYQVCKQADTVLAHVLFEDWVGEDVRRRSYDYYEKITTHDSSLSHCIFCIDACRLGLKDEAQAHFGDSVKTDLMNTHGNSKDGIHTANMGGCYMAVVNGFAGLKIREDGIRIDPFLPDAWNGLSFLFHYHGSKLRFEMQGAHYSLTLLSGEHVQVFAPNGIFMLEHAGDSVEGTK